MKQRIPSVRLQWSWRWAAAMAVLVLALHEAHELAHTWLGRILCGRWGSRDFNTWSLADGCEAVAPTAAGPVLTYAVLWVGAGYLLTRGSDDGRRGTALAVALLFASNPFARLLTVALGGGDELVVAASLTGGAPDAPTWGLTLLAVLAIVVPPLYIGWRALRATPRRSLWFAGLLLLPTALVVLVLLVGLNGLLAAGLGARPVLLGEPALVLAATLTVFVLTLSSLGWLDRGVHEPAAPTAAASRPKEPER